MIENSKAKTRRGVIFIAGAYGTGKTTIAEQLSKDFGLPCFQASELITAVNKEAYGKKKDVSDVGDNQKILADSVNALLDKYDIILLTGHFAIFDKNRQVVRIPTDVFSKINLSAIILLEAPQEKIMMHLGKRDAVEYSTAEISELVTAERELATGVATQIKVPLYIHQMNYDNGDSDKIAKYIKTEVFA